MIEVLIKNAKGKAVARPPSAMGMKYVGAYLMAILSGKEEPTKDDVEEILKAGGISYEEAMTEVLIKNAKGKAAHELIAAGSKKFCAGGGGGAAPAAAAAPAAGGADAGAKKEEKVVEEEEDDDAGADFDLFG